MNFLNILITLAIYFSSLEVLIAKPLMGGGTESGCTAYKIVSARGTGESQTRPTGNRGFVNGVLAAVPGGENYEVVYPATIDYARGPMQGANDANRYLTAQQSKCPEQVYVMIGYSEGAMVVTQIMRNLPIPSDLIVANVLYGNPYFTSGAPQNSCSAKTGMGIASATRIQMPAQFSSITFDCCLTGDTICQTTGSIRPHLAYPGSSSEKEAIDFAVGKLESARNDTISSIRKDNKTLLCEESQ